MTDTDTATEIEHEVDLAFLEALLPEQEAARLGQSVEDDLDEHGPLYAYAAEMRARCVTAIRRFTSVDLDDKAGLRDCQDAVRAYIDVMDFIRRALISAEQANTVLAREMGDQHEAIGGEED